MLRIFRRVPSTHKTPARESLLLVTDVQCSREFLACFLSGMFTRVPNSCQGCIQESYLNIRHLPGSQCYVTRIFTRVPSTHRTRVPVTCQVCTPETSLHTEHLPESRFYESRMFIRVTVSRQRCSGEFPIHTEHLPARVPVTCQTC